jgi:hypothetical protein
MFQTRQSLLPDVSGRTQIWLILGVYRWLGPLVEHHEAVIEGEALPDHAGYEDERPDSKLSTPMHEARTWMGHTVDADEMIQMRVNWDDWFRRYGRKCMPDWSICQLHPDDFQLR